MNKKRSKNNQSLINAGLVWEDTTSAKWCKWCKRCPTCNEVLSYSQATHCFYSVKKNLSCVSCSKSGKNHPNYGKHLSKETAERIGLGNRGKIHLDETKRKISLTKKQNPTSFGSNQFHWKKYTFPDGRVESVQGWEPWTLDLLLSSSISPNDIKIKNKRPIVPYEWSGSQYRYIPDCYISSSNTIVETKSPWTLNYHYGQNMSKITASIEGGYNVRLVIWERRHHLKSDITYRA